MIKKPHTADKPTATPAQIAVALRPASQRGGLFSVPAKQANIILRRCNADGEPLN
jgi:hypothetical protein